MSNVAPTDSHTLKQSKKKSPDSNGSVPNSGAHGSSSAAHGSNNNSYHSNSTAYHSNNDMVAGGASWESPSSLYFPSFCPVHLGTDDIALLNQVV